MNAAEHRQMPFSFGLVLVKFEDTMLSARHLIEIHRERRTGPGRRTKEMALNRGIVVLAVATWQTFVQDLVRAAVDWLRPRPGEGVGAYRILRAQALQAVNALNTPNADNVRGLLWHIGCDVWPGWTWTEGSRHLTNTQVEYRLNGWLKVRHAVAHGHDVLPEVTMLARTRGGRALQRHNAEACVRFFERLAEATALQCGRELKGDGSRLPSGGTESGAGRILRRPGG